MLRQWFVGRHLPDYLVWPVKNGLYTLKTICYTSYLRSRSTLHWGLRSVSRIVRFIEWPLDCCFCQEPDACGTEVRGICAACRQLMPMNQPACRQCASPQHLATAGSEGLDKKTCQQVICVECQFDSPPFQRAAVPYLYRFPADQLVLQLKFRDTPGAARAMAWLIVNSAAFTELMQSERPDCLVPVPLEASRFRRRGYNQALQLADWISRYTECPVNYAALTRPSGNAFTHQPRNQTRLGRQARLSLFQSPEGVFQAARVAGLRVLLVDDVMTTGATFSSATLALFNAGAERVSVCAFARTPRKD